MRMSSSSSRTSNSLLQNSQIEEPPKESLISRLLIAPLTFISFILSLALISNQNTAARSRRPSAQPQPSSNLLNSITRTIKSLFLFRSSDQSSNPYADIKKPVPLGEGDGRPRLERGASSNGGNLKREEGWYWHSNQKKLLKMEVREALEIRRWVLVVLLGVVGVGLGVGVWGLLKVWRLSFGGGWQEGKSWR